MALVNEHLLKLPDNYLFTDIAKKVNSFKVTHSKADIIHLGIEDTGYTPQACIDAMHRAIDELNREEAVKEYKYGPEGGYDFLKEAVIKNDYHTRGIYLDTDEIFISSGAKPDIGGIGDILRHDNSIGVTDPHDPVYIDSNVSCGRAGTRENSGKWSNVIYLSCSAENNFVPSIPQQRIDIIYLCHPHIPTGTVLSRNELKRWVNYALKNDTIIMFDASYEAYIRDTDIPHSIYEIKEAKKVAIEFKSFSQIAGSSAIRCGYTIIPKEATASTLTGKRVSLHKQWIRRLKSRPDSISYITQRGAEAVYTDAGKAQIQFRTNDYMSTAKAMKQMLINQGIQVFGGENAPYLWIKNPSGLSSWKFFDKLLYEAQVIGIPGINFGPGGEGYLRLTAFGEKTRCEEGIRRLCRCL